METKVFEIVAEQLKTKKKNKTRENQNSVKHK